MNDEMDTDGTGDPSWWIVDPRPIQKENQYTYFLPSQAETAAVEVGDVIKLLFEGFGEDGSVFAERMWVECTERDGKGWFGTLDNQPFNIVGLALGDRVIFPAEYMLDTYTYRVDGASELDQYLRRCHLDARISHDRAPVFALERRKPKWVWWWKRKDETYPDTGWHIFAAAEGEDTDPDMQYVAIGRALNVEDGFLTLLDSPVGTRIEKRNGRFEVI